MADSKKLMVEKEQFDYKGKTYNRYFVRGQIRGKEVRASLNPPDNGGFIILDIMFEGTDKLPLVSEPFEVTDDKTGRVISGNTYSVVTTDENGNNLECKVKPYRASDKSILEMLLKLS